MTHITPSGGRLDHKEGTRAPFISSFAVENTHILTLAAEGIFNDDERSPQPGLVWQAR